MNLNGTHGSLMLISKDILEEVGFDPKRVLHIGGHTGEEQDLYDSLGVQFTTWVEALPDLVTHMRNKFRTRKDITVVRALISDKIEMLPFYVTNNLASSSILDLGTHETSHPKVHVTHEKIIQSTTIKELGLNDFDTFNLDIQGAELRALKGADLTNVKWIYTEVNTEEVYRDCALMWQIDEFLHDFKRIETNLTKYCWGDALYKRI